MSVHMSPLSLYKAQVQRFTRTARTVRQMHEEISRESALDAVRFTSGASPSGKERKRWLAKNRPFARNISRSKLRVRYLPIGQISGLTNRSFRVVRERAGGAQVFGLRNAAQGRYTLLDAGTRKMRGRGFQKAIRQSWRARNKALIDTVRKRMIV